LDCVIISFFTHLSGEEPDISISFDKKQQVQLKKSLKKYKMHDFGVLVDDIHASVLLTRELAHTSKGDEVRNITEIVRVNERFSRICSENAKVFVALMQAIGYSGRVIWLDGHTVSEIYHPETGWIMVDPHGNVIFKNKFNEYMSLLAVNKDYQNARPEKVVDSKYLGLSDFMEGNYLTKDINVFKNQTTFVVLDGNSLFSIHKKNRDVGSIFNSVFFGEASVAEGLQYITVNSKKYGNFGISFYNRFFD